MFSAMRSDRSGAPSIGGMFSTLFWSLIVLRLVTLPAYTIGLADHPSVHVEQDGLPMPVWMQEILANASPLTGAGGAMYSLDDCKAAVLGTHRYVTPNETAGTTNAVEDKLRLRQYDEDGNWIHEVNLVFIALHAARAAGERAGQKMRIIELLMSKQKRLVDTGLKTPADLAALRCDLLRLESIRAQCDADMTVALVWLRHITGLAIATVAQIGPLPNLRQWSRADFEQEKNMLAVRRPISWTMDVGGPARMIRSGWRRRNHYPATSLFVSEARDWFSMGGRQVDSQRDDDGFNATLEYRDAMLCGLRLDADIGYAICMDAYTHWQTAHKIVFEGELKMLSAQRRLDVGQISTRAFCEVVLDWLEQQRMANEALYNAYRAEAELARVFEMHPFAAVVDQK